MFVASVPSYLSPQFESMPLENRSISVHMKMGEIYEKKASPLAIPSFQNVLKMNPYSLHAVAQLVNLSGAQVNEVKQLYTNEASNPFHRWIHHYIDATYAKKHHKFKGMLIMLLLVDSVVFS